MTTAVDDPTMDLIERYVNTRDPAARDQLVTNYLPLVRSIARRFRNSREPMEDLVQMGTIGLLNAIEKFDMSHGVRFASLAILEVYGSILNHLRDHGGLVKVPRALRHNEISGAWEDAETTASGRRSPRQRHVLHERGMIGNSHNARRPRVKSFPS